MKRFLFSLILLFQWGLSTICPAATLLTNDSFESGLGNWSGSGTRYTYPGTGTNFATTGVGAAELKKTQNVVSNPLGLDAGAYQSVTISFDYKFFATSSLDRGLRLAYREANGNFIMLARIVIATGGVQNGSASLTLTDGVGVTGTTGAWKDISTGIFNFADTSQFRLLNNMARSDPAPMYIDNIIITAVPEVSSALLGLLGVCLSCFHRRR